MVPTQVVLAAMVALVDPAPTPTLSPPDDPIPAIRGDQMRFVHPVATNPNTPASQTSAHHTDQPSRKGGGGGRGGSGGGGSSGSSGNSGTNSSRSQTQLAAALAAAQQEAANGTPGQTASPPGEGYTVTGATPHAPTPTVLPNPTDQTTDTPVATPDLFTPPTSSGGVSPVVPADLSPVPESPIQTPEPGTMILCLIGAGISGGAAVRKWIRRKK